MSASPPRNITVLIDTREKFPLLFPKTLDWHRGGRGRPHTFLVKTKTVRLPAGDYALLGYDEALIERKGSLRELSNNIFSLDARRSRAAFQKLIEATENPYLLLDLTLGEMMTATEHVQDAKIIVDALLDLTQELGLKLLIVGGCRAAGARRMLGEFVIRLLLSHAMASKVGPIDVQALVTEVMSP